jgi:hypothetical protein
VTRAIPRLLLAAIALAVGLALDTTQVNALATSLGGTVLGVSFRSASPW